MKTETHTARVFGIGLLTMRRPLSNCVRLYTCTPCLTKLYRATNAHLPILVWQVSPVKLRSARAREAALLGPVRSEANAIAQCLEDGARMPVERGIRSTEKLLVNAGSLHELKDPVNLAVAKVLVHPPG